MKSWIRKRLAELAASGRLGRRADAGVVPPSGGVEPPFTFEPPRPVEAGESKRHRPR